MSDLDELLKNPPPLRRPKKKHRRTHHAVIKTASIRSDINVTPLVDVVLVDVVLVVEVGGAVVLDDPPVEPTV